MKSLGYSIKFLNITNNDHIIHNSFKKHASFERYFHKIVVPFFKREKSLCCKQNISQFCHLHEKKSALFSSVIVKKRKIWSSFQPNSKIIEKKKKNARNICVCTYLDICYQYLRENVPNHLASFLSVWYLCQINFTKFFISFTPVLNWHYKENFCEITNWTFFQ